MRVAVMTNGSSTTLKNGKTSETNLFRRFFENTVLLINEISLIELETTNSTSVLGFTGLKIPAFQLVNDH